MPGLGDFDIPPAKIEKLWELHFEKEHFNSILLVISIEDKRVSWM